MRMALPGLGFFDAISGLANRFLSIANPIWVNLTVDLFGEQTAEVMTAALQAACLLLAAIAVVLWSVRTFSSGRYVPIRADAPRLARLAAMDRANRPSHQVLENSLAARGPPVSSQRFSRVQPPGVNPRW